MWQWNTGILVHLRWILELGSGFKAEADVAIKCVKVEKRKQTNKKLVCVCVFVFRVGKRREEINLNQS